MTGKFTSDFCKRVDPLPYLQLFGVGQGTGVSDERFGQESISPLAQLCLRALEAVEEEGPVLLISSLLQEGLGVTKLQP